MSTDPEPLAELIRSGDADRVAAELLPMTRRIAGHVLHSKDPHLVDAAAADAVLAICRYGHTFRGESKAFTWVYSITRRAAIRCARREAQWYGQHSCVDVLPEVEGQVVRPGLSRREALEELARLVRNPDWRLIWLLWNEPECDYLGVQPFRPEHWLQPFLENGQVSPNARTRDVSSCYEDSSRMRTLT